MPSKRTAVIEDVDAFMAWLATMPLIVSAAEKRDGRSQTGNARASAAPSKNDAEFLAALKSMA